LLSSSEQALFQQLSVFAGGWTLEAALAVCRVDGSQGLNVLEGLQSLLDNSLVRHVGDSHGDRSFRMLETLREYAGEQLDASCTVAAEIVHENHVDYYLALAERAQPYLQQAAQQDWLDCLDQEQDNLRAALVWLCSHEGSFLRLVRLLDALLWFWVLRYHVDEGRSWFERVLAGTDAEAPSVARAQLLYGAGMFARAGVKSR